MTVLAAFCLVIGVGAFYFAYNNFKGKSKIISIVVGVVAIALCILFFILAPSKGKSSNKYDDLSDEEKEWYQDNYGNGQYDKYKDAIDNYK